MLALLTGLAWKSALVAGAALLVNRAMHGRPAAERVFLLRIAIMMLLALPVAAALLPALDLAVLPALTQAPMSPVPVHELAPAIAAPVSAPRAGIDPAALVVGLYLAGAGAVLLHLALGIVMLTRWTRRSRPVADPQWQAAFHCAKAGLRRPVRLLESRDVTTPLSWGIAPIWILVDPDSLARGEQADAVMAHEMAHVRRLDWPMLVVARIAVALFWCNPLAWLLARALVHESEIAADEAALLRVERLDYAQALLAFATAPTGHRTATGMALWPSALKERIARVVEARGQRRSSRVLLAAMLVCGIGSTPTLAALQFVRAAPGGQDWSVRPTPEPTPPVPVAPRAAPAVEIRAVGMVPTPSASATPLPTANNFQPSSDASPIPTVVVAPRVVAAPIAMPVPVTRIVGRTGASVIQGPGGTTITGAPDDQAEARQEAAEGQREARREMEEGRREAEQATREAGLERRNAARQLRSAAAEMRQQADDLDRIANEPGQPESLRRGHASGSRSLRDNAAKMEAQAAGLENS